MLFYLMMRFILHYMHLKSALIYVAVPVFVYFIIMSIKCMLNQHVCYGCYLYSLSQSCKNGEEVKFEHLFEQNSTFACSIVHSIIMMIIHSFMKCHLLTNIEFTGHLIIMSIFFSNKTILIFATGLAIFVMFT